METLAGNKYIGKLVRWHDDKGFGFIQCDELTKDVFIHISALKHMSRAPKVGDRIHFQVEKQSDDKLRACQCRIEGVMAKPESNKRSTNRTTTHQRYRKSSTRSERRMYNIVALIVFGVVLNVYHRFSQDLPAVSQTTPSSVNEVKANKEFSQKVQWSDLSSINDSAPTQSERTSTQNKRTPTQYFRCDGRQHCSQMRSREEAVFFIRNCPNTKMDGDNDGIPCENDSRF